MAAREAPSRAVPCRAGGAGGRVRRRRGRGKLGGRGPPLRPPPRPGAARQASAVCGERLWRAGLQSVVAAALLRVGYRGTA